MTYRAFWQQLMAVYPQEEAKAVAKLVMEKHFGLSMTDIVCGEVEKIDESLLKPIQQRLLTGEPVQYVLGVTEFCGRDFLVAPGVLIPRPETQWMCHFITSQWDCSNLGGKILDMGTGSGCIACTLALELSHQDVKVTGWDISDKALSIAAQNAQRLRAKAAFVKQDMLCPPDNDSCWDVIVSNPPYICRYEQADMASNVLDFEPHEALFVPDDAPLLYYQAIGRYAQKALKDGGFIIAEINERLGDDVVSLFASMELCQVDIHKDQYGKDRYVTAWKEKGK